MGVRDYQVVIHDSEPSWLRAGAGSCFEGLGEIRPSDIGASREIARSMSKVEGVVAVAESACESFVWHSTPMVVEHGPPPRGTRAATRPGVLHATAFELDSRPREVSMLDAPQMTGAVTSR